VGEGLAYTSSADSGPEPSEPSHKGENENMIRKIIFAAALIAIALAPDALADERFELTPFIGYRFGGDFDNISDPNSQFRSVDVDDSEAYGLIFDINMGENAQIELSWSGQDTTLTGKQYNGPDVDFTDTRIDYWHVGGNLLFGDSLDDGRGFLAFSIGGTHSSPENFSSETQFSFGFGGGAKFYLSDTFGVRLQGKLLSTYINSSTSWWCSFGCWTVNTGNYLLQAEIDAGLIVRF
jgi:hypothetical protein